MSSYNNKLNRRGETESMQLTEVAITQLNLQKNTVKGDWKETEDDILLKDLDEEVAEFKEAIYNYRAKPTPLNLQRVREEAGDVMNAVMMPADKCGALEKQKSGWEAEKENG